MWEVRVFLDAIYEIWDITVVTSVSFGFFCPFFLWRKKASFKWKPLHELEAFNLFHNPYIPLPKQTQILQFSNSLQFLTDIPHFVSIFS